MWQNCDIRSFFRSLHPSVYTGWVGLWVPFPGTIFPITCLVFQLSTLILKKVFICLHTTPSNFFALPHSALESACVWRYRGDHWSALEVWSNNIDQILKLDIINLTCLNFCGVERPTSRLLKFMLGFRSSGFNLQRIVTRSLQEVLKNLTFEIKLVFSAKKVN